MCFLQVCQPRRLFDPTRLFDTLEYMYIVEQQNTAAAIFEVAYSALTNVLVKLDLSWP